MLRFGQVCIPCLTEKLAETISLQTAPTAIVLRTLARCRTPIHHRRPSRSSMGAVGLRLGGQGGCAQRYGKGIGRIAGQHTKARNRSTGGEIARDLGGAGGGDRRGTGPFAAIAGLHVAVRGDIRDARRTLDGQPRGRVKRRAIHSRHASRSPQGAQDQATDSGSRQAVVRRSRVKIRSF